MLRMGTARAAIIPAPPINPASPAGRFVIVLTDGEDHEDLAAGSADPALPVQTMLVGLGTTSGGPIPIRRTSRGTTYKKDNNGEVVITKRDFEKLNSIGRSLDAAVIDGNNQIVGSINPSKIINTVFGGRKNNN